MKRNINFQVFTISCVVALFLDYTAAWDTQLSVADYGSFTSPGYPDLYPNAKNTSWLVRVPTGKRIKFYFGAWDLEPSGNCTYDYLKVYDGASDRHSLIGTYCGSYAPAPLTTSGNVAGVFFRSDNSRQRNGFHITYSSQPMLPSIGLNNSNDDMFTTKKDLRTWFLNRRKSGSRTDRWGSNVHRIAVALHLADNSTFEPESDVGKEILYELTIQLLRRLTKDQKMNSQELALYIHALLVCCMNPRDFYGDDLVKELRRRVETAGNYTNPFLLLVLCNAGEVMTSKDLERVMSSYDSQHRPFWTDSQALASMALSCIASQRGESVDERTLKDMLQELKRHQFRNGTVDNFRTTALVTQALFIHDSCTKDFDLDGAIKVLTDGLNTSKSLLNAYYVLPVLHGKSLLNVSSSHCRKQLVEEEEALEKALDINKETINVQYSVWLGDEINLARTWRLKLRINSTIYDAIETVAKIDNRQKVEYNVVDGKPYVAALNGKEDDPEMGIFWFIYLKTLGSDQDPKIVEESPVDIKLKPNQEIILWHKRGPWSGQNVIKSHT